MFYLYDVRLCCVFAVWHLCRILSRLHRRWGMVDNYLVLNTSRRRVRCPRSSTYWRGSRSRIIPADRTMPQVLGRASVVLYVERHPSGDFTGKSLDVDAI